MGVLVKEGHRCIALYDKTDDDVVLVETVEEAVRVVESLTKIFNLKQIDFEVHGVG